jgi:hypothetical protein
MSVVNWLFNTFASDDVIDLNFVMSDLVDVFLTDSEIYESACFDSLANTVIYEHKGDKKIPLGKLVL